MRITIEADGVDGAGVVLDDVFSGIGIRTDMGLFGIAQRDGGIEVMLDGKTVWTSHELPGGSEHLVEGEYLEETLATGMFNPDPDPRKLMQLVDPNALYRSCLEQYTIESDMASPNPVLAALDRLTASVKRYKEEAALQSQATSSEPVRLPDGSGYFIASWPLPKDHWLYAEHDNDPPMPFRTGTESHARDLLVMQVRNAARYAIRASTMNGKEMDFDPDAMVQNMVVGLLGRWTKDGR